MLLLYHKGGLEVKKNSSTKAINWKLLISMAVGIILGLIASFLVDLILSIPIAFIGCIFRGERVADIVATVLFGILALVGVYLGAYVGFNITEEKRG